MDLYKEWKPMLATNMDEFGYALKCVPSVVPTTEQSSLVDIVRCKDCMLNTINTDGATEPWCYKFGYAVEDTDFCSYGERREE